MSDPNTLFETLKTYLDTAEDGDKTSLRERIATLIPNSDTDQATGSRNTEQLTETISRMKISQATKMPRYQKGESFSRYCERFIEYVYLSKLEDKDLYLYFLQNVDDKTYSILKTVNVPNSGNNRSDPKLFCTLYKSAIYGEANSNITLRNEVLECKQAPNETISDYTYRLREKASIAFTNSETANETCLSALLRGIRDQTIKRKLNEDVNIVTFQDAEKRAKRLEQINNMLNTDTPQIEPILKETSVTFQPSRERNASPWPRNRDSGSRERSPSPWNRNRNSDRNRDTRSRSRYRNSRNYDRTRSNNSRQSYRSSSRERNRSKSPSYVRYPPDKSKSPYRDTVFYILQIRETAIISPSYTRRKDERQDRTRNTGSPRDNGACWECNKPGHFRYNCPLNRNERNHYSQIRHIQSNCPHQLAPETQCSQNYHYCCQHCTSETTNQTTNLN